MEVICRMRNLVDGKGLILLLPLILATSLFVPSGIVPSTHAAGFTGTGLVCITTSVSATNCDDSAPAIGPLTVGSTFSVGVFINNSQPMNGFDVFVGSDPAFVNPTGASLGTLIANPSLTDVCINNTPQTGVCSSGMANGPGVVEVTTVDGDGINECGDISPCSGLAFTINYTVVGSTSSTAIFYPTASGCSPSSVSSPPDTCVLVADGFYTVLPENIQGANVIQKFTGLVCITDSTIATSCPASQPIIGPHYLAPQPSSSQLYTPRSDIL